MSGRGTRTDGDWNENTASSVDEAVDPSLGLDDLFGVLADEDRRRTVRWLAEQEGTVDRTDLAEALGADPTDGDDRLETRLHHVHLPALDDADVVDYDPKSGTVRAAAHLDVTVSCLATVEGVHVFAEDYA